MNYLNTLLGQTLADEAGYVFILILEQTLTTLDQRHPYR